MKTTYFAFTLFTFLFVQAHANPNMLEDACGCEALSSENIKGLYTWSSSKDVCIGFDEESSPSETLVAIHENKDHFQKESLEYLTAINFEIQEDTPISSTIELIAEREVIIRAENRGEQIDSPQNSCPVKTIGTSRLTYIK